MFGQFLFFLSFSCSLFSKLRRYHRERKYKLIIYELFNKGVRKRPRELTEVSKEFLIRKAFFLNILTQYGGSNIKFIHVTGTKGKGSLCEFISVALRQQSNLQIGVFTSPHLHTTCERIKINGQIIDRGEFNKLGEWALNITKENTWMNFFDVLLTIALRYYGEHKVDYVILEAGLGGRFDSTNFIDNPLVSIITSISLDHQSMLGDTVEQIAWHKAGIIKSNGHVFTSNNLKPSVLKVIQDECNLLNATLHISPPPPSQLSLSSSSSSSSSTLTNHENDCFRVQQENISLARAVCNYLHISDQDFSEFYWPCRMESFHVSIDQINEHCSQNTSSSSTTTSLINKNNSLIKVIVDGCHNGASVDLFMSDLRQLYPSEKFELWILVGMGKDKNVDTMLKIITDTADQIIFVKSRHFRALSEVELFEKIPQSMASKLKWNQRSTIEKSVGERLHETLLLATNYYQQNQSKQILIAICGSLFAAAEGREELFRLQPSLFRSNDWVRYMDPEIPMEGR